MRSSFTPAVLFVSLAVAFFVACTPYIKYTPGNNIMDLQGSGFHQGENTLPSGNKIVINSAWRMDFPNGPSALVLNYSTSVSLDDMKGLRAEVDEIWPIFVKDVNNAGLSAAALRPVNGPKGYGFVFEKRPDGTWYCTNDEKKDR